MKRYYKKLCIMLILSFIINFFSDAGEIVDLHALAAGTITVDCPTCSGKGTIPCPNIGVYDKAYFTKLPNYFACWTCAKSGHIEDTEHQTLCYRCSSGNQTVPQVTCPVCKGSPLMVSSCPNQCDNGKVNGICDICGKVAKPDGSSNNYVGTWKDCYICGGAGMVCGWECNFCHKIADTMQNFTRDKVHVNIDCPDCEGGTIEVTQIPTPMPSIFSVTIIDIYDGLSVTREVQLLTAGDSFSASLKPTFNGVSYVFDEAEVSSVGNKTSVSVNQITGKASCSSIQSNVTAIYYYTKPIPTPTPTNTPTPLPTEIPDAENELRATPTPITIVTTPPTPTPKPIAKDPTPTPPQTVQNIIGNVTLPTPIVLPQKPMPTPAPIYVPAHKTQTVDRTENTVEPTFATSSTDHCDACFEEETDVHVHSTGAHENYATARAAAQPR